MRSTDEYEGMIAETITLPGHGGDNINAYYARPLGPGPYPAVVLFHHRPGWDEWYREATRRFAHHGYLALCPDLYSRFPAGPPDEVAARVRAEGDVSDEQCRRPTGPSRRSTAGPRSGTFCPGSSAEDRHADWSVMCTTIGHAAGIAGSGRSTQGWFRFDRVWLSYDHPFHAPVEHAVSVDFVDGSRPSGERVAVELTREAARQLAFDLLAVADQADAYEAGLTA